MHLKDKRKTHLPLPLDALLGPLRIARSQFITNFDSETHRKERVTQGLC